MKEFIARLELVRSKLSSEMIINDALMEEIYFDFDVVVRALESNCLPEAFRSIDDLVLDYELFCIAWDYVRESVEELDEIVADLKKISS